MTHRHRIKVALGEVGPREIELEFTDEEWQVLTDYAAFARELGQVSVIAEQRLHSRFRMSWEEGQELRMEGGGPPWEEVVVVLQRARPFILEGEPTYFHRIANILARRGEDATWREFIAHLKAVFSGDILAKGFQITVQTDLVELVVTSERALALFLNAREFHREREKRELIDSLFKVIPEGPARAIFLHLLIDKVNAIGALMRTVEVIMGKQPHFGLQVPNSTESAAG